MSGVHLSVEGRVAELRLDNPAKLNALTTAMLAELDAHCATIAASDTIGAIVVSAEPARAFCAGADIDAWSGMAPMAFARDWVRAGHRIFDRLARLPQPSVAAIGAPAFGGGLELAAACDIRVIAPRAALALPETGIGIVPGWSGTQRLTRLLPEPVLKEMALFGRRLDADRAFGLGFVAEIAEDADAAARAIARDAAGRASPDATAIAKALIHAARDEDRAALTEALGGGLAAALPDRTEGVAAFRAKRAPSFGGAR